MHINIAAFALFCSEKFVAFSCGRGQDLIKGGLHIWVLGGQLLHCVLQSAAMIPHFFQFGIIIYPDIGLFLACIGLR